MASLRAAELEVLYTANTAGVAKGEQTVKESGQRVESKPITKKIDADASEALAGMDRVEAEAKQLVSERAVLQLDADVARAEKQLERAQNKVEDLQIRGNAGFEVTADLKRAEAALGRAEAQVDRLQKTRATVEINADTAKAESQLDSLADKAADAGSTAGAKGGSSFVSSLDGATRGAGEKVGAIVGGGVEESLVSALTAIPVAGGIVLAGVAIGKAITGAVQDGLQQEVGFDRLEALTGISPADALRIGRASGEAYANVFGDSVEANMDTARLALQLNIFDSEATTAEARKTVEGLAGIADVMREDVQPVATATATLLRTGLARSAQEAFDLIAAGEREGANRAGDWLDTLIEYPALFQRLGLSGPEALGLINQGLEGGARNADLAADALKEFQIRATDASTTSAAGFEALGLNAEEMTAKIARGGQDARDGLDLVLTRLRETEDPVLRNAAAVALFGTQAEDLGDALFNMDLSTAVDQIGQVEGAAQRMFDTLADNDASKIESAQRNIEVAMDGIKGTLAAGFSEPLGEAAAFITANRGPVTQFFLDLVNGAINWGESMVIAAAEGTVAFGEFIAGPGADVIDMLLRVQQFIDPLGDHSQLEGLRDSMRDFDDKTAAAADTMRDRLLGGLEDARTKVNEFGEGAVAMGYLNDASLRLADAMAVVGTNGEGARLSLEGIDLANLGASASGAQLEQQILNAAAAMEEELAAAQRSGEGQAELTSRYNTSRDALISQIEQMGIGREAAGALVDQVLRTPPTARTEFSSNAPDQQGKVQSLADRIVTLPDGSVIITADTSRASGTVNRFINDYNGSTIRINVAADSIYTNSLPRRGYHGGVVEFMAQGGIPDLTPMSSIANVIPANTWRVVGDRGDVPEAFIPLDGSARSMAILAETIRRMPGLSARAAGGIDTGASRGGGDGTIELGPRTLRELRRGIVNQVLIDRDAIADAANESNGNTAWREG